MSTRKMCDICYKELGPERYQTTTKLKKWTWCGFESGWGSEKLDICIDCVDRLRTAATKKPARFARAAPQTETWEGFRVHSKKVCEPPCPIHAPSDHHMRDWPLNYRGDRAIMERICEHDVGHPDPDDKAVREGDSVHGCDGCCTRKED